MLTAYQCETAAYQTEDGELLCPECFDRGDTLARPVSRYALDEEQSARGQDAFSWEYDAESYGTVKYFGRVSFVGGIWHVEDCACESALYCDACGSTELVEAYTDPTCRDIDAEDVREDGDEDDA